MGLSLMNMLGLSSNVFFLGDGVKLSPAALNDKL
jgi:hypothetical protein